MQEVFPNYYKDFQCIAGACPHSCCIGWEIDIDPDTAQYYKNLPGPLGEELRAKIAWEEPPHFILEEGERCPFLNEGSLCRLILGLGEDCLCGICTEHPRFYNDLPGRVEGGLGLCCPEAARLVLSQTEPVTLEETGEFEEEDPFVVLRDRLMGLLQERDRPIQERVDNMLDACGGTLPRHDLGYWADLLLELERLTPEWTALLEKLKAGWAQADFAGFDRHMEGRQTEYEQFLVYLIYRHFAAAEDSWDAAARAAFAALGYEVLHGMGAVLWTERGEFTFEDQCELVRLFSSELEYSEENLEKLFFLE